MFSSRSRPVSAYVSHFRQENPKLARSFLNSLRLPGSHAVAAGLLAAGMASLPVHSQYVLSAAADQHLMVEAAAHLFPTDPQADGRFGYCSGVSGDTAVIGAFLSDGRAPQSGAAYVFVRMNDQWVQQAKLVASDGQSDDWFGASCAISGDTVVIGAPQAEAADGSVPGALYVFQRRAHTWTQAGPAHGLRPARGCRIWRRSGGRHQRRDEISAICSPVPSPWTEIWS